MYKEDSDHRVLVTWGLSHLGSWSLGGVKLFWERRGRMRDGGREGKKGKKGKREEGKRRKVELEWNGIELPAVCL